MEDEINKGKQIVIDYIENNFWFNGQIIITEEEMKQMKDELEMGLNGGEKKNG